MGALETEAAKNGQAAWPFRAGAAAAAGLVFAIVLMQATRVVDTAETRLPAVATTLALGVSLALAATWRSTHPIIRCALGSASAGLIMGTAVVAGLFGLLLLPAALLVGSGAAVALEAENRSPVRLLGIAVFVAALAVGVWRVIP